MSSGLQHSDEVCACKRFLCRYEMHTGRPAPANFKIKTTQRRLGVNEHNIRALFDAMVRGWLHQMTSNHNHIPACHHTTLSSYAVTACSQLIQYLIQTPHDAQWLLHHFVHAPSLTVWWHCFAGLASAAGSRGGRSHVCSPAVIWAGGCLPDIRCRCAPFWSHTRVQETDTPGAKL